MILEDNSFKTNEAISRGHYNIETFIIAVISGGRNNYTTNQA